jgi:hypothetical protein
MAGGSHGLALRGFDLDDLGAHVGKHPRAMRSGKRGRKVEHAQTIKSFCQITLIVVGYGHSQRSPGRAVLSFIGALLGAA